MAFFGANRAGDLIGKYEYASWYIGGHSLGGVAASSWAAAHPEELDGVILLASYPVKALDSSLTELTLYGSEDKVIDPGKIEEGLKYAPADHAEQVIEGGNHAQFGSYGTQKGDGEAKITAEKQVEETVKYITEKILR